MAVVLRALPLLAFALPGCSELAPERISGPGVVHVEAAELAFGDGDTPPASGWEAVELPDVWGLRRRRIATRGFYRAEFTVEGPASGLWAVYAPQVAQNVRVEVNGERIGGLGRVDGEPSRRWVRPLYLTFPASVLAPGKNVLSLRYVTDPGAIGVVPRIVIGPDAALRASFDALYFVRRTLPQLSFLVATMTGILVALLAVRRRHYRAYRWFSAAILLWAFRTIGLIVAAPPGMQAAWSWLLVVVFGTWPTVLIVGLHRALGLSRPGLERVLAAVVVAGAATRAAVPPLYQPAVDVLWAALVSIQGLYVVWLIVVAAYRRRIRRGWLFVVPALVTLAVAVLDLQLLFTGRSPVAFPLFELVPPIALLAILAAQIASLGDAVESSETLNRELEQRVAEKHAELEQNYARMRALERERAASDERERLLRDMHDGMGAQLVSTLALVEGEGATSAQVADALRDALDELRLMLDALDPEEEDLLAVLGTVRGRLEPRLLRAGMRFEWLVRDVPALAGFGARGMLHVLRIVQEAISNALRHACARTIAVRTGEAPDADGRPGVFVEVRDDGRGMDTAPKERRRGRGLANMRRRADELGGRLTLASDAGGTSVRLWLPLEPG